MPYGPDRHRTFSARWQRFWFEPVPVEIFAVLRIAFGVLGLITLAGQLPIATFWASDGILQVPRPGDTRDTIANLGLAGIAGELLFWTFALALLGMTVGLASRVMVAVALLAAHTQTLWGRLHLSRANAVLVVMLFCLLWAKTGAVWSVDAWLERRRSGANRQLKLAPVLPLRLIQFQIALLYFNSGLWKIYDSSWRDGTALYWAVTNNVFQRFPFALPLVNDASLTALTYLTVFWEISFPFLLLHRWTRRAAILIGVMVHIGIMVMMEVGPFSPLMLAAYIAFIDPHRVAQWNTRRDRELSSAARV